MDKIVIKSFKKVMVANRGEIAIRVFRALSELGIQTVGIFSKEDKYSLFRTKSDESYMLNVKKGAIDAYLDIDEIIRIAKSENVDAIHPGYGFLSENPEFIKACNENDIVFIGPTVDTMETMGDKITSKQIAIECNVPIVPGIDYSLKTIDEVKKIANEIGYPIMFKASNGGGGRGMRIVYSEDSIENEFMEAKDEARKAFGDELIFIEKYLHNPKHIEVQVLGDSYGNIVHLYDRDCSVQRRHQKVVEYAPAFTVPMETREKILKDAIVLAKKVNYTNAGTLEFLLDADNNYYFIEMNPRIQVEHTVTEEITGIDIVQAQILIAQGYPLNSKEININSQDDIKVNGYSIQCRVTSEDCSNNFFPDTGKLTVYRSGSGFGIRLDAGNAFVGSEITPYYDSLLVKVISHARSFENAIEKAIRSLKEMRIRGIKTNIPFLINVLNNEVFRSGNCTTTFIETTKELLDLTESKDRATKILEFIGNIIVNENKSEKPDFILPKIPKIDATKKIYGAKDELKKLGPKEFTQKILKDKKLYVTDTTMRDAHQSLIATRMRTADLINISEATNAYMANAFSVEAWGGATFDVAYRFLKESPWVRLEQLSKRMPNTLIQMLLRASNAVGYTNYPDNVVRDFIKVSAERGIDVFRIFDSLNWIENMKMPIDEALKTGKIVEGAICYTGDILSPNETKYTIDYYVKKAKELESLGVHIFAIKDMAGLLKPYAAKKLVSILKSELSIPIHLHTHDSTGNGVSTVLMAAEAGVDIVDLALESMSSLTSQPSLNAVLESLKYSDRDTGLNSQEMNELSNYYSDIRSIYKKFESEMNTPNTEIYNYEIPGGQYSNLLAQVKSMGSADDFKEIKELYKQANNLFGNIVKVTPSSKVIGDMAIFMFKNKLTQDNIFEEGKELSYPDSVIEYFKGMMGQPDGGFPKVLQKIILKDEKPITVRPGTLIPSSDYDKISTYLEETYGGKANIRNILSYALYPKVYDDYNKHKDTYNDITRLESHIFFSGMKKGEESTITIGTGKDVIIKYIDSSDSNQDGKRTLTFEVNGAVREVEIIDEKMEVSSVRKVIADKQNPNQLGSPIPGTIGKLLVSKGDVIKVNTPLFMIEAMKMEATILSKVDGKIDSIYVKEGTQVIQDELLATFILD